MVEIDEAQLAQLLRDQQELKVLQNEHRELIDAADRNAAKMTRIARINRSLLEQLEQAKLDAMKLKECVTS